MSRRQFLTYPVDDLSAAELLARVDECVRSRVPHRFFVINANKMYLMKNNSALTLHMREADVVVPENAIYFGMSLIRTPLKARDLGGLPLARTLLQEGKKNGYRFFLFGSSQEVVSGLARRIKADMPGTQIVGWRNGYFEESDSSVIAGEIAAAKPDVLLVALGSPKQELWISTYLSQLNVPVCLGVGGSFEVLAGFKKDAPQWTKYGFEWLYRSIQDPKKFKRYIVVNSFFCAELLRHFLRL